MINKLIITVIIIFSLHSCGNTNDDNIPKLGLNTIDLEDSVKKLEIEQKRLQDEVNSEMKK